MSKTYKVYADHGFVKEDFDSLAEAQDKAQKIAKNSKEIVIVFEIKNEYSRIEEITERVKTFEDAMSIVHEDATEFDKICERLSPDEIAYKKLKIIAEALNEGWDWNGIDENQERWFPWFYRKVDNYGKDCGLLCARTGSGPSFRSVYIGSRLFVKTEKLAIYFGTQFIDLWRAYYLR